MNIEIIDANAVTALLRGEAGKEKVLERLTDPETHCLMHAVNVCERLCCINHSK